MICESLSKYSLYNVYNFIAYVKNIITFFGPFWKTIILVFLGLILSIQELQYEDNLFRQSHHTVNNS